MTQNGMYRVNKIPEDGGRDLIASLKKDCRVELLEDGDKTKMRLLPPKGSSRPEVPLTHWASSLVLRRSAQGAHAVTSLIKDGEIFTVSVHVSLIQHEHDKKQLDLYVTRWGKLVGLPWTWFDPDLGIEWEPQLDWDPLDRKDPKDPDRPVQFPGVFHRGTWHANEN